jgi:flagellar biosynthetic protein FlhB
VSDDQDRRRLEPSPRRVREFRKRGEIARSQDLVMVATLVGGLAGAFVFLEPAGGALVGLVRRVVAAPTAPDLTLAREAMGAFAVSTVPVAIGAWAGWAVATFAQLGWPPALKKPGLDLSRQFSPANLGQIFSPKSAVGRVLMSTAKVGVVVLAVVAAGVKHEDVFMRVPAHPMRGLAQALSSGLLAVGTNGLLALAGLAAVDYLFKRYRVQGRMRMTPEEAKREHREAEGDPEIKRRRRQRMREAAKRRHEAAVKAADVVVVNPTHYAVALRYRAGSDKAPRVVAKGQGRAARRIRDLARRAGVPIVSAPPLARSLHRSVKEGQDIPYSLYHAVAEVLAYVYRLRNRRDT